jgi:hypothetical protein
LKSAPQDLLVGNVFSAPTFENPIDTDAFGPLKLVVAQIGIVNHFRDFAGSFVLNSKSPDQRFERAIIPIVREIALQHVESERASVRTTLVPENEFRFRIDEFADEPCRTDTIDLRPRPSEPDSAAKISPLELRLRFRPGLSFLEFPQNHLEIFRFGAAKKICLSDFAKLFSNAIKSPVQI